MKKIKKLLKLSSFIIVIILASIGLGFNAAIFPTARREEKPSHLVEQVENEENENEASEEKQ